MNYAIQLEGLRWRAGSSFTLEGVDLSVPRGSIYGFLGPNGVWIGVSSRPAVAESVAAVQR